MATTTERKYALTKIAPGDYLLPSNDAKTIWRIMRYEDGPSHGLVDLDHDIMMWGIWRYTGSNLDRLDPDEWGDWEHFDGNYITRKEAIDGALSGLR